MKPSRLAVVLVLLLAQSAPAQTPAGAPAFAEDKEARAKKVDELFEKWNKPDSPGCALAIIKDDQIIYKRGYGMADLERGVPISPETVFHVGSISKQFTAMTILMLAQQGKLSVDDDIRKFIPEMPDYGTPVTVRQLLLHTSGLRDQQDLLWLAGWRREDEQTEEDILGLVSRQKELNFKPGEEFGYSNTNYTLLAVIAQRVTKKSLRELAEANIFKPLGMTSTVVRDDHALIVKNRAVGYLPRYEGGFGIITLNFDYAGSSNLNTTVEDLARWDRNFYDRRVGGNVIELMLTPGTLNDGTKLNNGYGLLVGKYKGLRIVEHGGADPGFISQWIQFPDQKFSVACLCNTFDLNPAAVVRQVATIYLAERFPPPAGAGSNTAAENVRGVQVSERELAKAAGLYFNPNNGSVRKLYVKEGKLFFWREPGNEVELAALGDNRFRMVGVPAKVEIIVKPERPGAGTQMLMINNDEKPSVFEHVEAAAYTPERMAEFVGSYRSEELNAVYELTVENGKLMIGRRRGHSFPPLAARFADGFADEERAGVSLRFTRKDRRRVTGFILSRGRIRGLRFTKVK